jgi:MFS family permease
MLVTAVFVLGACGLFAMPLADVTSLVLSRVFLGLAVGGSTQVVPTYISELAPASQAR